SILKKSLHFRPYNLKSYNSFSTSSGKRQKLRVEIQIRTLLQDAWAVLTHRDVYRNRNELPPLAQPICENMSDSLASVDRLADRFREAVEAEVKPPNDLSDNAPLDREALAFLFFEVFGCCPQEQGLKVLGEKALELEIRTVSEARNGLSQRTVGDLQKIWDKRIWMFPASKVELMSYALSYGVHGPTAYIDFVEKTKREWQRHLRTTFRDMPGSIEELVDLISQDDEPCQAIVALGGFDNCDRCGESFYRAADVADAICRYYDCPETDVDLESLLADQEVLCGVETEYYEFEGLCSYCGRKANEYLEE
ncbi:hypothetical protein ACFL2Q_08480, partial [Thermodesulfobacteriota bacterium]